MNDLRHKANSAIEAAVASVEAMAAEKERAKIVAWLRGETGCAWSRDVIKAADAIAAGEYLK